MWGPFVVDGCNYLIKCCQATDVKVYVTDFKSIWVEDILIEDLITRFQDLNPLMDVDTSNTEDILHKVKSLIIDIHLETLIALTKENDNIKLELKRKRPEFHIKCKFNLHRGDKDMFFNEFTIPLIQSVQYLEVRQKKLFDLLEKKDREIQEHELEGGEISRKSLKTKKFDKTALLDAAPQKLVVNVFGKSKAFLDTFTGNYGSIANTVPKTETEHKARKKFKTDGSGS